MFHKLLILILFGCLSLAISCTTDYYDDDPIEYIDVAEYDDSDVYYEDGDWIEMFEDLDYYGLWYEIQPFGWVWRPTVVLEWQPYYHGEWIMTVAGWTWVSYEPFGWAVYHYGYWVKDFALGWVWVPDYEWAPCHVNWVVDDDYVYWAPMGPYEYVVPDPWDDPDLVHWVGIKEKQFDQPQVGRYKIKRNSFIANPQRRDVRREPPDIDVLRRDTGRDQARQDVQLARERVNGYEVVSLVLPPPVLTRVGEYRVDPRSPGDAAIVPPAGGQLLRQPVGQGKRTPSREITPPKRARQPRDVEPDRRETRRGDNSATDPKKPRENPRDKPDVQPKKKIVRKKKGDDRPVKQRPPPPKRKLKPPEKKDPEKKEPEKKPETKDPPPAKEKPKEKPKDPPKKARTPAKARGGGR